MYSLSRLAVLKQENSLPRSLAVLASVLVLVLGLGALAPVTATADSGAIVTGTVINSDGLPLESQEIELFKYSDATYDWNGSGYGDTNEFGIFTITGLPAGQYKLRVSSGNGHLGEWYNNQDSLSTASVITVGTSGTVTLDQIQLSSMGTITGTVVGANGLPLNNQYVELQKASYYGYMHVGSADTNAAGEFTITGVLPGDYKLLVFQGNGHIGEYYNNAYSESDAVGISIGSGQTIELDPIQLSLGASVTGTITDLNGQPLKDETVVIPFDIDEVYSGTYTALTNASGWFMITGLQAGQYKIKILPANGRPSTWYYNNKSSSAEAEIITLTADQSLNLGTIKLGTDQPMEISLPSTAATTPVQSAEPAAPAQTAPVVMPVPAPATAKVTASLTKVKAPKSVKRGKKVKVTLTVKSSKATRGATVTAKLGKKTAARAKVGASGRVTLSINTKKLKLKKGKTYSFTIQYQGNNVTNKSKTKTVKIKVK